MVGTSHRSAGLAVRERFHYTPTDAAALAAELPGGAVVLATCNRTEVYVAFDLAPGRAALSARGPATALVERHGDQAVLHLLRVTAGLDSHLPGEAQILGQVREAYDLARRAGTTGGVLGRLFEHALHTGKRVRSQTGVGTAQAAIPEAAAELAREVVGDLVGKRVLVIGAGKMGELAASSFFARGAERIFIANHRVERAEALAARLGGEAVPFDRLGRELERADVVLSSTRCPQVVLRAGDVAPALAARRGRPLVLVDIAVPRDLDPAIGGLEGCFLFDLDALGSAGRTVLAERDAALAQAEALVAEEAAAFAAWLRARDAARAVAALRRRADEIRESELARARGRLAALSPEERAHVETLTAQIVNKLLHEPTVRAKDGDPEHAAALRHLFALDGS
jgi:glutamyl-tRNA reductase